MIDHEALMFAGITPQPVSPRYKLQRKDDVMGNSRHTHFIGFRGNEYFSAVKAFGPPDFIHLIHDRRLYGDVGPDDILVFGPKADPRYISEFSWQDHELW